jgi:hypothetical protein
MLSCVYSGMVLSQGPTPDCEVRPNVVRSPYRTEFECVRQPEPRGRLRPKRALVVMNRCPKQCSGVRRLPPTHSA